MTQAPLPGCERHHRPLSTLEVSRLSGLSPRQIQRLDDQGVLDVRREQLGEHGPQARRFSAVEVLTLRVYAIARDRRFLRRCEALAALPAIRRVCRELLDGYDRSRLYVLIDRDLVRVANSSEIAQRAVEDGGARAVEIVSELRRVIDG